VGRDTGLKIAYDGLLFMNKEKVTAAVLLILLALRLANGYLTENIWGDYTFFYQILIILPLLLFVVFINQKSLHLIRVDKPFLLIFVMTCFLLCFYFWDSPLEIILLAGLLLFYRLLFDQNLVFENDPSLPRFSALLVTILGLIPMILFGIILNSFPHFQSLFSIDIGQSVWIVATRLWNAVYQVMLFWGILWMVLKKWGINNVGIFIIQAVLFWLAYANLLPSKTFWVTIPILGFWLGYLTMRSKSLTPATITYFVYNMIVAVMQLAVSSRG
jgi:hypothetical protein